MSIIKKSRAHSIPDLDASQHHYLNIKTYYSPSGTGNVKGIQTGQSITHAGHEMTLCCTEQKNHTELVASERETNYAVVASDNLASTDHAIPLCSGAIMVLQQKQINVRKQLKKCLYKMLMLKCGKQHGPYTVH